MIKRASSIYFTYTVIGARMQVPDNIVQIVRSAVIYDPDTGKIVLNERPDNERFNNRWAGKPAFNTVQAKGKSPYGVLNGIRLYAKQVAWICYFGEYRNDLYYFNGNPLDNRLLNIRARGFKQTGGFPVVFINALRANGYGIDSLTFEVTPLPDNKADMYPDDRDDWW